MERRIATEQPLMLVIYRDSASAARRCFRLSGTGWRTLQVCDAVEALSAVRSQNVDVVLLHMPVAEAADMDLADVLRRIAPCAYLPVVVLTEDPADRQRCDFLNSGADDIICNRISDAEMIARVRVLLRIKELQDELSASRAALEKALHRERQLMVKLRRDCDRFRELSHTDPLTHVHNVRAFKDLLEHEFKVAKRYGHPISLLMLDVDHFKVVNDTHGHPSGDYVLKELAVILRQSVRESDVVARTGGEEFCALLPRADREQAEAFAQRIRLAAGGRQFNVYGRDIHVTVSVGAATFPTDAETTDPQMLVFFADHALLEAKESGRDRVVAFGDMAATVRHRLRMEYLKLPPYMHQPDPPDPPVETAGRLAPQRR